MNLGNIPINAILGVAGAGIGSLIKQKRELDHPSFGYEQKSSVDYGKIAKTAVTYAKAYKEAKVKEEAAKAAEQTETYNEDDIIDVEYRVID